MKGGAASVAHDGHRGKTIANGGKSIIIGLSVKRAACGFSVQDLESVVPSMGSAEGRRWLRTVHAQTSRGRWG